LRVKRHELEHLVRAAATIIDDDELIVIGSQSVLEQFPEAPSDLLVSVEADLIPRNHPERADLIDGSIGELSPFHETFGYYAQGVEIATATLPNGWAERLIPVRGEGTRGATGWCLEVNDLALSKYVANREKDAVFLAAAVRHRMINRAVLMSRVDGLPVDEATRQRIREQIGRDFAASR
jgi:hypothetical protein